MPMVRAMRMLNAIELGTLTSAQLETLLQTPSRALEWQILCGMRGQTRRMATTASPLTIIVGSPTATSILTGEANGMKAICSRQVTAETMAASADFMTAVIASSTAFAAVAASSTAMTAVAASSTAMTAIYANSSARAIFIASSVNTVAVPTMTSNTAPSGVVTTSSFYDNRYGYFAFDSNATSSSGTYWKNSNAIGWIAYQFTAPVLIHSAVVNNNNQSMGNYIEKCTIQYSDDGSTWTSCTAETTLTISAGVQTIPVNETSKHAHWRFNINNAVNWCGAIDLDFIGFT